MRTTRTPRSALETPVGTVSGYVASWVPWGEMPAPGHRALDLPCGRGRHAYYLARLGYSVAALDIDPKQLAYVESLVARDPTLTIEWGLADANAELPFRSSSFDLVVTTHFVSPSLLRNVGSILKSGGKFIYETFGGQGQNWRGLPRRDEIARLLASRFELLDYQERSAGPPDAGTVVVRAVGARR